MLYRFKSSLMARRQLGPLEDELLRVLWTRGDATVRELIDDSAVDGAYTTIMTTLDRLYKKGLLERSPEGRAFRYRAKQSEAETKQEIVAAGLKELLNSGGQEAPISFLVEAITEHDAALLAHLQQAVAKKRRDLRKRGQR